jgi:hypothetical protein
MKQKQTG